jgi:hypothetical protein
VKPDDYNFELPETGEYFLEELRITLKILKPAKTAIEENIFKCADFWLSKGVLI